MFAVLFLTLFKTCYAQDTETQENQYDSPSLKVIGSPLTLFTRASGYNSYVGHIEITNTSNTTIKNIVPNFSSTGLDGQVKVIKNSCKKSLKPQATCTMQFSANSNPIEKTSFVIQGKNIPDTQAEISIQDTLSAIGMQFGGGKIVCLKSHNCQFNLIVSKQDHSIICKSNKFNHAPWFSGNLGLDRGEKLAKYATSDTDGYNNTKHIVSLFENPNECQLYAAKLCESYSINSEGVSPCTGSPGEICYDNWYLPAKDELNSLYENSDILGKFPIKYYYWYWSSTFHPLGSNAWGQNFGRGKESGVQRFIDIKSSNKVRCVRSF